MRVARSRTRSAASPDARRQTVEWLADGWRGAMPGTGPRAPCLADGLALGPGVAVVLQEDVFHHGRYGRATGFLGDATKPDHLSLHLFGRRGIATGTAWHAPCARGGLIPRLYPLKRQAVRPIAPFRQDLSHASAAIMFWSGPRLSPANRRSGANSSAVFARSAIPS